jgi:hypothetical protein
MAKKLNGASDGLVVRSADLAAVVKPWIEAWYVDHDYIWTGERWSWWMGPGDHVTPMGPYDWLSQETGFSARSLYRVLNGETKHTAFRIADTVLTVIGREDAIDAELAVIPNPQWSQEKWMAWYAERTHCDE